MSISSTLSTALTGLTASSRMAEVTASNVSNALTEGYAPRTLNLSSRSLGQTGVGVTIDGVTRTVDPYLLRDFRLSAADVGSNEPAADFLSRMEAAVGSPDQASSLSGRISTLEASLIEAAARPESDARLATVLDAALAVTSVLTDLEDRIQVERQAADAQIAANVTLINDALSGVADLNIRIRAFKSAGRDTSALMDQRQKMVDSIADLVPLREMARDHDQIALVTTAGTVLLDGRAATLSFAKAGTITPDMTLASGALSGLQINGQPVKTSPAGGRLGDGRLAALFEVRDTLAPSAQSQIDALARDLVERFSAPSADPTLGAGAPGLFTDSGGAFDPLDEVGLAGRVAVNVLARPDVGGGLWRLRDGLGAAAPGALGQSAQLLGLSTVLTELRIPASGGFSSGARSFSGLASEFASSISVSRLGFEAKTSFSTARSDTLKAEMLRDGVDTDQEMQNLLLIEQAYAANAKVIQTADELINILLGM